MSTAIGRQAEDVAAAFLESEGYLVLNRNWRTRQCEIDIVAEKDHVFYFVEVKYRSRSDWGEGFDYITGKKLRQMHFAAEYWLAQHAAGAADYRLSAMELSGEPPIIGNWLESIV